MIPSEDGRRGLEDLFWFCTHFFGLDLQEKPHRLIIDAIETSERDETHPYAMIIVPRGVYKTSIARVWLVWRYLREWLLRGNVYHRTVISSASLGLGKQILSGLEGILRGGGKNARLENAYGKLWADRTFKNEGSRRVDAIVMAPRIHAGEDATVIEPTFFLGSLRRISTGFHADDALVDDINNKDNVRTDHQRKLTHEYFSLLYPILTRFTRTGQPSRILMNATPWHDDDVRGKILRQERDPSDPDQKRLLPNSQWTVLHHGIYCEDGSSFFPEKYPLETLDKLREDMGTEEFSANILCDPVGEQGFVHEDSIRFKDRATFPEELRLGRISVDPNQHTEAKELGCWAAIAVGAYDRFNRLYILDARGSRAWGTQEFIEALFKVQEDYPGYPIYMEDSHMGHFDHAIRMEQAERSRTTGRLVQCRIHYVPVDVKATKYQRWQKIEPRFRNGTILFSDSIVPEIQREIRDEFVRGRVARFKDFLDAVAGLETGVRPRPSPVGRETLAVPAAKRSTAFRLNTTLEALERRR